MGKEKRGKEEQRRGEGDLIERGRASFFLFAGVLASVGLDVEMCGRVIW